MTECHAVALDYDGYQFSPSDKGEIHVVELTDVAAIRSVNMIESQPAKTVLAAVGIEDYVVKSPRRRYRRDRDARRTSRSIHRRRGSVAV
jgi:hypothetical protein